MQKLKLLKKLYLYRYLGYEYFEEQFSQSESEIDHLPNSIKELQSIVSGCNLCSLSKTRKNVVFGEGNIESKIIFIGEGPGMNEDNTGRPFVGKAGELLTKIIQNVLEIKREEVYIANIVKCRPPNNRVPMKEEADMCIAYLFKQIELIKPKILVTLGTTAYKYLTNDMNASITRVRGEVQQFDGMTLIPTFHPSYLLRNPSAKKDVFNDFLKIKKMMGEIE